MSIEELLHNRYMFFLKDYQNISGIEVDDSNFHNIKDKRYCDFNFFYSEIGKLGSGAYGSVLKGVFKESDTIPLAIKISGDDKEYRTEVEVLDTLFHLIERKNTPHITIPIFHYKCNFEQIDSFKEYIPFKDMRKYAMFGIIVMERVYTTLDDFIFIKQQIDKKYYPVLFLQLILTFYCIRYFHPDFVHGDLHECNILIRKSTNEGYTHYDYGNYQFYLPNIGFQIVIADFGISSLNTTRHKYTVDDNYHIKGIYNLLDINSDIEFNKHDKIEKLLDHRIYNEYRKPKGPVKLKFTLNYHAT